jgi:cellulose synthase/poly-beta-1,6-N-acetylglucosamine synthase-like glycosyltransferase
MSGFAMLLAVIHTAIALGLAAYGLNAIILSLLYLRHAHDDKESSQEGSGNILPSVEQGRGMADDLPTVTVQVPVFNERHVINRAIDAVAALDYPRDRLQIQILDDSRDDTTRLARERAAFHRSKGLDIEVLRRVDRDGFKAGALARGLDQARGDAIAIFDADFRPYPDFLLQTVPHFLERPRLGFVQVRWSHLNGDYSPLTRAQAIAFDGHFVVEQTARNRSGLLINFNGTAGVWRRACIEESGGWEADTLTEDLDLGYRAQLAGWETLYLLEVDAPAELPPQIAAFRRQQARWTQGSVQTLRKLMGPVLRSRQLSLIQKGMALLHLSSYLSHALMVLLLLVTLPLLLLGVAPSALGKVGLLLGFGTPLVYLIAQQQLHSDWRRRLRSFPLFILVGIGIAWNNALAVWRGLTRWGGTFARTPKFRVEGGREARAGQWLNSAYRLGIDGNFIGESALALYALASSVLAYRTGQYGMMPYLLLYAAAFGTVAGMELAQVSLLPPRND